MKCLIISLLFAFTSGARADDCRTYSTEASGCKLDLPRVRMIKDYLVCRSKNSHADCIEYVQRGVTVPGLGYIGTSPNREQLVKNVSECLSKSPQASHDLAVYMVGGAVATSGTPSAGEGVVIKVPNDGHVSAGDLGEIRRAVLGGKKVWPRFLAADGSIQFDSGPDRLIMFTKDATASLESEMRLSPRTTLEPLLRGLPTPGVLSESRDAGASI